MTEANGKTLTPEEIKEQRKLVRGQIQLARLNNERKLLEMWQNVGGWDDFSVGVIFFTG